MMTNRVREAMERLVALKVFNEKDVKEICMSTFYKYHKEFNIKVIHEVEDIEMTNEEVLEILQAAGEGEDFYGYCEEFTLKDGKFYKVREHVYFEVE